MDERMNRPIPVPGQLFAESEPQFCDSPLVQIEPDARLEIHMMYPALGMRNGYQDCLLRKEAADMLETAKTLLPEGCRFVIWDAWRPVALQQELYTYYRDVIIEEFHLAEKSPAEQAEFISQFVADPVADRTYPPAHTTGGAIDLTIAGPDGLLAMGTEFDAFTDRTETTWFEQNDADETVRDNRRLLYHIMTEAGFTNLASEWWHYETGDRNWSKVTGRPACYAGIFTPEEAESMII